MRNKSKVLFVLPFCPYPLVSGGHQAIFNGVKAACDSSDIVLTYPQSEDEYKKIHAAFTSAIGGDNIHLYPWLYPGRKRRSIVLEAIYWLKYAVKSALGDTSVKGESDYDIWMKQLLPSNNDFITHVNQLVEDNDINIVQCEMLETIFMCLTLPKHVKKIFVHHELGFVRKELKLKSVGNNTIEGKAHLELNKMIEVGLLNQYDSIITLSSVDTDKLLKVGVTCPIHTSFAIVSSEQRPVMDWSFKNRLLFIGPEWHPSNKEGLLWFLNNCWNRILEGTPTVCLCVIGKWTKETVSHIQSAYKNVVFRGYVEDLCSEADGSTMIVPITIGSGIRMKILEAGALGIPVVSTTVGAEGLPLVSGSDIYIADTPSDFVKCVRESQEEEGREAMVTRMRGIIGTMFSMESLKKNRECLYHL